MKRTISPNICPSCRMHNFSMRDKMWMLFCDRRCPECGRVLSVKIPLVLYFLALLSTPIIMFWIIFPILPFSPVYLLVAIGISYEIAVVVSLISLIIFISMIGAFFGKVVCR